MFRDEVELKDIGKIARRVPGTLGAVVTIQADREIGGPHLYVRTYCLPLPARLNS
jgi:hypothetical protein